MADLRVDSLEAFLGRVRSEERPVVYRLAHAERYACHAKWTNEMLETLDIEVGVHRSRERSFFDPRHSALELARSAVRRTTTVGDLVRRRHLQGSSGEWEMISGTDTHLVLENGPVPRWRGLWEDCKGMADLLPGRLYRVGFWISGGGNLSSQMHWDVNGHHNLNFQVKGKKHFVMFAPHDSELLYPMPSRLWHLSRINPREPAAARDHPLFARAHPIEFDLYEGDVLYIPSGWWHHVTHDCEDTTVNVTFWFHSDSRSGIKWTWSSLIVPKPWEAYRYCAKLIFALVVLLPPLLLFERCSALARRTRSWTFAGATKGNPKRE